MTLMEDLLEMHLADDARDDFSNSDEDAEEVVNMRIRVKVLGMLQTNAIVMYCGEGHQTVKWLALAVAQRLSNQQPRGARRTYEHTPGGCRGGFVVPGEIVRDGLALDPLCKVNEVLEDGDSCFYKPGALFAANSVAKGKVAAHTCGIPNTYLSPFAQRAFYSNTSKSLQANRALHQRSEYYSSRGVLRSRYEDQKGKKPKMTEDDVLAARFRILMSEQSEFSEIYDGDDGGEAPAGAQPLKRRGSTVLHQQLAQTNQQEEEAQEAPIVRNRNGSEGGEGKHLARLAVENLFSKLSIHDICPDEELEECQEVTLEYMDDIDNVFKYYAGFSSSGAATLISRTEFHHFICHTHVFDDHDTAQQVCDGIFEAANRNLTPRDSDNEEHQQSAHDNELTKYEFLECVLRIAHENNLRAQKKRVLTHYSLGTALKDLLEEHILPCSVFKEADTMLKKLMADKEVQAMFSRNLEPLLLVYKYYAASDHTGFDRPSMNFEEFQALMHDSGLVPPMEKWGQHEDVHDDNDENKDHPHHLTVREVRQAFSQAQSDAETTVEEMSELVFAEFIESLARVALAKWETDALRFVDKVKLALEAVIGIEDMIPTSSFKRLMPEYFEFMQNPRARKHIGKLRTTADQALRDLAHRHEKEKDHHHGKRSPIRGHSQRKVSVSLHMDGRKGSSYSSGAFHGAMSPSHPQFVATADRQTFMHRTRQHSDPCVLEDDTFNPLTLKVGKRVTCKIDGWTKPEWEQPKAIIDKRHRKHSHGTFGIRKVHTSKLMKRPTHAGGSAANAARMMNISHKLSNDLRGKYRKAQSRLDRRHKMDDRVLKQQLKVRKKGGAGFMFKPVTAAWSTISENENAV